MPIEEASAKIRTGNPVDDEADYEIETWAGVIPLKITTSEPANDGRLKNGIEIPDYVVNYQRMGKKIC